MIRILLQKNLFEKALQNAVASWKADLDRQSEPAIPDFTFRVELVCGGSELFICENWRNKVGGVVWGLQW
ncbi:hypothetical protein ACFXTH_000438 [Malus domestica]